MARFYGAVGYGVSVETSPGVWEEALIEVSYYGDLIKNARKLENVDKLNSDISVSNSISIVADEYAVEHFFAIRYARWAGVLWTVTDVEVQHPRLILRLGGVYNGPTA
jgi:hypothetical protein